MKFLADEQFPHGCTERLRLLGLAIDEVVAHPDLIGQDDVDVLLPYVKRHRLVLLSGDHVQDSPTRLKMWEHFGRTRTGRMVIVKNVTGQHWTRTLAKFLWHLHDIEQFFGAGQHGLYTIGDLQNYKRLRPGAMPQVVRIKTDQGYQYLHKKDLRRSGPVNLNLQRKRRAAGLEQPPLL